ncbi:unnamed protein product [Trichogramma brassicae]|uniref:Uncharacterized protein n=1 Tax=Trichogramma brassicae TaxID=86971 RepID=A0A6H5IZP3_9HYME|nr:unnamed protein product [Trichogramma brassicae]
MNDRAISLCNAPERVNDLRSRRHARARDLRYLPCIMRRAKNTSSRETRAAVQLGTYTRPDLLNSAAASAYIFRAICASRRVTHNMPRAIVIQTLVMRTCVKITSAHVVRNVMASTNICKSESGKVKISVYKSERDESSVIFLVKVSECERLPATLQQENVRRYTAKLFLASLAPCDVYYDNIFDSLRDMGHRSSGAYSTPTETRSIALKSTSAIRREDFPQGKKSRLLPRMRTIRRRARIMKRSRDRFIGSSRLSGPVHHNRPRTITTKKTKTTAAAST